jgi:hypothetical protein
MHLSYKLIHIDLYVRLAEICPHGERLSVVLQFELTTLVVIGTDCTGSCKSTTYDHDHDGPESICVIVFIQQFYKEVHLFVTPQTVFLHVGIFLLTLHINLCVSIYTINASISPYTFGTVVVVIVCG